MYTQRQSDTDSLALVERLIALATLHLSVTRWTYSSTIHPVAAALALLRVDREALVLRLSIFA